MKFCQIRYERTYEMLKARPALQKKETPQMGSVSRSGTKSSTQERFNLFFSRCRVK